MITLNTLKNTSRPFKRRLIVGRGPGSKRGKTCCRGQKGMGARSGYQVRERYEGGGVPLYRRLPTRGFSNARFTRRYHVINLGQIDALYKEGEVVSLETLRLRGFFNRTSPNILGVKVLGSGKLTKTLSLQVEAISEGAKEKLKQLGIAI